MKRLITALALTMLLSMTAQSAVKPAQTVVADAIEQIFAQIESEQEILAEMPDRAKDLVHNIIVPHIDFFGMCKWILGKKIWDANSAKQRQQFVNEFKMLVVNTYAKSINQYLGQSVEYLPADDSHTKPNLAVVKTRILNDSTDSISIDYRMRLKDDNWKIVDIVVDGISLVKSYRGSFLPEIKKDGFDALITRLSQLNNTVREESPN